MESRTDHRVRALEEELSSARSESSRLLEESKSAALTLSTVLDELECLKQERVDLARGLEAASEQLLEEARVREETPVPQSQPQPQPYADDEGKEEVEGLLTRLEAMEAERSQWLALEVDLRREIESLRDQLEAQALTLSEDQDHLKALVRKAEEGRVRAEAQLREEGVRVSDLEAQLEGLRREVEVSVTLY